MDICLHSVPKRSPGAHHTFPLHRADVLTDILVRTAPGRSEGEERHREARTTAGQQRCNLRDPRDSCVRFTHSPPADQSLSR
jgi:hypothetical protein